MRAACHEMNRELSIHFLPGSSASDSATVIANIARARELRNWRVRPGRWTSEDARPVAGHGADAAIILVSNEKKRNYEERRARGEEAPKEDIEHGRGVPLLPEGPLALPPQQP
jgi:hypothetical protein